MPKTLEQYEAEAAVMREAGNDVDAAIEKFSRLVRDKALMNCDHFTVDNLFGQVRLRWARALTTGLAEQGRRVADVVEKARAAAQVASGGVMNDLHDALAKLDAKEPSP